ncbi:unnamed protein product, partial [Adineta steineri]
MMEMNDLSDENYCFKREDNHLETFTLIWLETNINCDQKHEDIEEKLRTTINHIKKFDDLDKCKKYIEEASKDNKLVVLISGQSGQQLVPLIHQLQHISAIYIISEDKNNKTWARDFPKLKTVKKSLKNLTSQINEDYARQRRVHESECFNMFIGINEGGTSTTSINGQFVFSQLLIDCLLRLTSNEMDKNELIDYYEKEYEGSCVQLAKLNEFEKDYSPENALWWYTRESFFYKTLNAALRKQTIDIMFLYRSYISDIHRQLQHHQLMCPIQVYRSQLMSTSELNYLQQQKGQLVSVNSFLSTSTDREVADIYTGDTTQYKNLERVLFEIDADPKVVTTKPFADISRLSHFREESEVLFMLGSIFRIESINCTNQLWTIHMSLCRDDEHDLKEVLEYMKKQNGIEQTNLCTWSKILLKIGKFDLAKKYYIRCVNELLDNDPLLLMAYEGLADIAYQQNDYDETIKWQQKLNDFKDRMTPAPKVSKWKQNGITVAGGNGQGPQLNQLHGPRGIFIDTKKNIFIADFYNHRIIEWKNNAKEGQIIVGINGQGNRMDQLDHPTD